MAKFENARQEIEAVANWLGWQAEDMSYGLKTMEDCIKLWRYAEAHSDLPEMADSWEPKQRKAALGYDPLKGAVFA